MMYLVDVIRARVVRLEGRIAGRVWLDTRSARYGGASDVGAERQAVLDNALDNEIELVLVDTFPSL